METNAHADFIFSEKVVFITGASRGIGKAIAEAFAARGAKLVLVSKTENVQKTANELNNKRNAEYAVPYKGDVSDYVFIKKAVKTTVETWGAIDILVNAAAILGPTGILIDNDPLEWKRTIEVNLLGVYYTMHEILPAMKKNQRGKIINFAGGGAAYAYPNFSAYGTSKAAVVRLTETIAEEFTPYNIQVNVIAPGAVETDMLKEVRRSGGEVRTTVEMDKPVSLVLFLASPHSNHITGRFIHSKDDYWNFPKDMGEELYKLRRVQ